MKTIMMVLILSGLTFNAIAQITMDSLNAKPYEIVINDSKSTWTWNLPMDPQSEKFYFARNIPGAAPGTQYKVTLTASVTPETHGINNTPNYGFDGYLYANEHKKKFSEV